MLLTARLQYLRQDVVAWWRAPAEGLAGSVLAFVGGVLSGQTSPDHFANRVAGSLAFVGCFTGVCVVIMSLGLRRKLVWLCPHCETQRTSVEQWTCPRHDSAEGFVNSRTSVLNSCASCGCVPHGLVCPGCSNPIWFGEGRDFGWLAFQGERPQATSSPAEPLKTQLKEAEASLQRAKEVREVLKLMEELRKVEDENVDRQSRLQSGDESSHHERRRNRLATKVQERFARSEDVIGVFAELENRIETSYTGEIQDDLADILNDLRREFLDRLDA